MLVLSRKLGEKILIDGGIAITVTRIWKDRVQLGIEAPRETGVCRSEICGGDGLRTMHSKPKEEPKKA